MKVICIDDVTDILKFGHGKKELTRCKEYEILTKFNKHISIINDLGYRDEYLLSRFVTRDEFREIKLNELGI